MNQQNQGQSSLPPSYAPVKRKRGRPRKDENLVQSGSVPIATGSDSMKNFKQPIVASDELHNVMVGQVVSGVIEAAFDAGYLLNVRVGNSDTQLRGVVFLPGRVAPITSENDVAPDVRMVKRRELPIPVLDPQTQSLDNTPSFGQKVKQPVGTSQLPVLQDQAVRSGHSDVFFLTNNRCLSIMGTDQPGLTKMDCSIVTSGALQEVPKTGKDSQSASMTSQIGFDKLVKKDGVCETSAVIKGPESDLQTIRDSEPISNPVDKVPGTKCTSKDIAGENRTANPVCNEIKLTTIELEHTPASTEFRTMLSDQITMSVGDTTEVQVSLENSTLKDNNENLNIDNPGGVGSSYLNERPAAAANISGLELNRTSVLCQNMTLFPSEAVPSELKSASEVGRTLGENEGLLQNLTLFPSEAVPSELKSASEVGRTLGENEALLHNMTLFPSEAVPSELNSAPEVGRTLGENEGSGTLQDTAAKLLGDTSMGLDMAQLDRRPPAGAARSFQLELGPALEVSQPFLSLVGSAFQLDPKSVADTTFPGNAETKDASIPGDIS